ncbi:MAG: hypothetical protein FWD69_10495 [Polyangiaceae bacterium]|nr:hypothetical protein [Polyangiaceae bacterium]
MIHEIGIDLGKELAKKGCPIRVVDGPEATTTTTGARERIVIEHDEDGGDSFSNVLSQHKNPKQRMIRHIGTKITIYAQSPHAGAKPWEHRRRVEHVLDLVLVALSDVLKVRRNGYVITKGSLIQPDDLAKSEVIAGAVYDLRVSIERGVYDLTWAYEARPEVTLTGIKSRTQVSLSGSGEEMGCGG